MCSAGSRMDEEVNVHAAFAVPLAVSPGCNEGNQSMAGVGWGTHTEPNVAGSLHHEAKEIVMRYEEIVTHVRQHGGPSEQDEAERALMAVVEVLAQRMPGAESSNLASQLPAELKHPLLEQHSEVEPFGAEEFLRRVAEVEGDGNTGEDVQQHVRAAFGAISTAVTGGKFSDVLAKLSEDYERLLPASR